MGSWRDWAVTLRGHALAAARRRAPASRWARPRGRARAQLPRCPAAGRDRGGGAGDGYALRLRRLAARPAHDRARGQGQPRGGARDPERRAADDRLRAGSAARRRLRDPADRGREGGRALDPRPVERFRAARHHDGSARGREGGRPGAAVAARGPQQRRRAVRTDEQSRSSPRRRTGSRTSSRSCARSTWRRPRRSRCCRCATATPARSRTRSTRSSCATQRRPSRCAWWSTRAPIR